MRSPCTATKSSPRSPQLEKTRAQQRRPNTAKKKKKKKTITVYRAPVSDGGVMVSSKHTLLLGPLGSDRMTFSLPVHHSE